MVAITGTLLVQIVVFLVFVYFIKKVLWGPVIRIVDERRQKISEGLAAAERGRIELDEAIKEAESRLAKSQDEARELLANAQRQANETLEQAREDARQEGDRIVSAAREEIDQAVASAKEDLRREVGELAVSGAERILKREIDAKAHNDIIDDLVTEIR
jgi:F-type H+-transporting ATPase subunit b